MAKKITKGQAETARLESVLNRIDARNEAARVAALEFKAKQEATKKEVARTKAQE